MTSGHTAARRRARTGRSYRLWIAGAALCAAASAARGDDEDAFNFTVGGTLRYDTNLFRLPSYTDPQTVLGAPRKSDWIATAYAGFAVDKPYGLQRFQLAGKFTAYRYDTFNYLDFNGKDYRAAWLWSLSPRLTGLLLAAQTQAPVSYADFRGRNLNIQTSEIQRAHADYWVTGGWHVTGAYDHTTFKNSAEFTQVGNSELDTLEGGVKYVAASGNSLGIIQRASTGNYLNQPYDPGAQLPLHFDQQETSLRGRWESGKSSVDGQVGYLSRNYDPFPARNYAGVVGQITYQWTPTGKLTFSANIGRNLYAYVQNTSSYFIDNYVYLTPAWEISAKTTARLLVGYDYRQYEGPIVYTPILRRDTTWSGQVGLDWKATRTLTFTSYVRHEQRISNYPNFDYVDTVVGITAGWKF